MDWQQIIVYAIVAAAAVYLARGFMGKRKTGGCGSCSSNGCASDVKKAGPVQSGLIQIEGPRSKG